MKTTLLVALVLIGIGAELSAQQVQVRLREEGTLAPVNGAIVRLLSDSGTVAQGLTDAAGRVALRAPVNGSYRLKIDRIGYLGILTANFDLTAGTPFPSDVLMPTTRLELPTIEVQTRSRCNPQGPDGREALAIWEEIQKALTANLITTRTAAIPLHVREFRRWLQRNGTPIREYNVASRIARGHIYRSMEPATLAEVGFVVMDARDSMTYAVPDAALLTSDAFVSTHCFGVTPGDEGLVGLTFEPVPGRKLPEVAGTIWVDRATGELKFLEYEYLNLPGLLGRAELGGRVEFQQLPTGQWIVSYWHVRTPDITSSEVRATGGVRRELPRHIGYLDLGGRVAMAGSGIGRVDLAIVRGRIIDSTQGDAGLAGAAIRVEGSSDVMLSGPDGRYELAAPLFGVRAISATHPKLGLLDEALRPPDVLSLGDTTVVDFGVPPLARFATSLCGRSAGRQSGVIGLVLAPDGTGQEGMEVKASWRTPGGGSKEISARMGRRGLYALCDLPADELVTIRVLNRRQPLVETTVEVGFRRSSWMDLWLPGAAP
ncbi:MAG: carboxypeptidase-like regulatory domain-containing protein [Gemmatimonadota bacterium]|nr:carboxypeptidase-like regulatory domain-containing protein [Gemmatimonadota bacterium]